MRGAHQLIKEQQEQIEKQQDHIEKQQKQLEQQQRLNNLQKRVSRQQQEILSLKHFSAGIINAHVSANKGGLSYEANTSYSTGRTIFISLLIWLSAIVAIAQGTSFTYQGRLTDGGTAANGNYDLQFTLWTAYAERIGLTQTVSTVAVSAGIFKVTLDFGATLFPAPSISGDWRAAIRRRRVHDSCAKTIDHSTPYAIRSLTFQRLMP
jgi:hypothetical protein